jgi:hypothetical protein
LSVTDQQQITDFSGNGITLDISTTSTAGDPYYSISVLNTGDFSTTTERYGVVSNVSGGITRDVAYYGNVSNSTTTSYCLYLDNNSNVSPYGSFLSMVGDSTNAATRFGHYVDMSGPHRGSFGFYASVQGSSNTNVGISANVNGTSGNNFAGQFYNQGARNVVDELQYGIDIFLNGNAESSTGIKYGANVLVEGDARNNYGVYIDVTGATNLNYSIYTSKGTSVFNGSQEPNTDFNVKGDNDGSLLYIRASSDNVGISTSNPTRKLDVRGDYTFIHNPTTELTTSVSGYGDVVTFGTGTLSAGRLYYLNSSQVWTLTDADFVSGSTGMLAFALGTSPSDGMLVRGYLRNTGFTTNTGDILYVSTTPGEITTTAPSGAGDVIRIIGYTIDGTNEVIYFSPDNSWVEI